MLQIPRLLFQTFETDDGPPKMAMARQTWKDLNPDWTLHFHDAEMRREFIGKHYGPEHVAAYDRLTSGAYKADFWRYCALYVHGGVYVDVDAVCRVPLDDVIRPEDRFLSARAGNVPWAIHNGFIACTPEHPFLARAVERALVEIKAGELDGYLSTGPANLGIAVNTCLARPPKSEHVLGENDGYRLLEKRGSKILDGDLVVMLTQYEGYLEDLQSLGIKHWQEEKKRPTLYNRIRRRVRLSNWGRRAS